MAENEASRTARIWHRAGLAEYSYLPAFQALSEEKAIEIFTNSISRECDVWIETLDSSIRGFIALKDTYIDRLYIDPLHQRLGVGLRLLQHAKSIHPDGLELHTHVQNHRARAVYERFGFKAVRFGTSPPPESMPDVEYHWRPASCL